MWIDTHCHLDAPEFAADRDAVAARAAAAGVHMVVLPAVDVAGCATVAHCAQRYGYAYALGIHPLAVPRAQPEHLDQLRAAVAAALTDPRFVGIGEIGLDFLNGTADSARQELFYAEQLRIAAQFALPVILHVRRSADRLLYHLRRSKVRGGIVHAFNGSEVQAQGFLDLGLRLGFGGSVTYDGSLRIRRFAAGLPADAIVLETDAPDIAPQWLRDGGTVLRNESAHLPRIAGVVAALRGVSLADLAEQTTRNAHAALPRLAQL
jgi:TatD DNase family protein